MKQKPLTVLLVDEGMNTNDPGASKIGGGQMARRRFFSNEKLFRVTLLSSEPEVCRFWEGRASILYEPGLQTYRPPRIHVARHKIKWLRLLKDSLRSARILHRHVGDSNADLIFLNDNKSRLLYLLDGFVGFKRKSGRRTAIQVDGEWKLGAFDTLMKYLYVLAFDKIICPTRAIYDALGPIGRLYANKLLVAYPGVEVPPTSEIRLEQNKHPEKKIVFGCIGTLRTAIKGQDIVIKAVSRLIKKHGHLPIEVRFFGDGPDKQKLANMIRELEMEQHFKFEGYLRDQAEIYGRIDACIVASRTETASIVIMESLIRNIPVITADIGGCKEILSRFYDDLFFEQGNDKDLASKMEAVITGDILTDLQKRISNTDKRIITRDYQVKRVFEFLSA